jgi:amidase
MSEDSIALLPAHQVARRVRAREVSPGEVLDACMAQVERHNPELNAVVTLSRRARDEAEALERRLASGEDLGPLAGLPVGSGTWRRSWGAALSASSPQHNSLQ